MAAREGNGDTLKDFVTLERPLGPHETEPLVGKAKKIFRVLYDETNAVHQEAQIKDPYFVVGRKGAGKTAFLLGAAFADDADVALIKSEHIYTEVNRLRLRYSEVNGPVVADNLAHIWEVLLFHAAMLAIVRSEPLEGSKACRSLWNYMSAFGHPSELKVDDLLAAVGAQMTDSLLAAPKGQAFRRACWSIKAGARSFEDAVRWTREVMDQEGTRNVYVVVDNLEDLHVQLDNFAPVITALFRLVSRTEAGDGKPFPFRMRFAFPAELLSRLNALAANAEKDFRDRQTLRWTAQELIGIVGNRLRIFLDLYFPDAPHRLGLPKVHDPADSEAADATLRALLPDLVQNRLGGREDAVAYLMRHTQVLPRHVILMLNHVMRRAVVGLESDGVPQVTQTQLMDGIAEAEIEIVEGILSSYNYAYPKVGKAMAMIKNRIAVVEETSQLHGIFNQAGIAKKLDLDFDEFIEGCVGIGALGIVTRHAGGQNRYTQGQFSYTFVRELHPKEDEDDLCVHPLFVSLLFDRHKIEKLASSGYSAIYPYGSDAEDVDFPV